ncbi:MAG: hypothetical protein ABI619_09455, partial [Betaproteobacteria bacterium]
MPSYRTVAVLIGLLAAMMTANAQASHPSYLILRGPVASNPHHTDQGYYPGYGYAVQPQAYSYGWFGAEPRRQWTHHNGYYRNYTEWSAR